MCRGPAAIAQPPSQATQPSNQGRFTFTFEQFLYKRRNNCDNSGLRPWRPPRPRPCSPGRRLDRDPADMALRSVLLLLVQHVAVFIQTFYAGHQAAPASCLARLKPERTRSSWTTMVWKKPGPPLPGLHLKPGRCLVSSFVQPVTVFIQTFLPSVLLFNLQQFLYKRFFVQFFCSTCNSFYTNVLYRSSSSCLASRLLPGSPLAWLASCLARRRLARRRLARPLPGPPPPGPPQAGEDEVIVDYHGLEEAWPASPSAWLV